MEHDNPYIRDSRLEPVDLELLALRRLDITDDREAERMHELLNVPVESPTRDEDSPSEGESSSSDGERSSDESSKGDESESDDDLHPIEVAQLLQPPQYDADEHPLPIYSPSNVPGYSRLDVMYEDSSHGRRMRAFRDARLSRCFCVMKRFGCGHTDESEDHHSCGDRTTCVGVIRLDVHSNHALCGDCRVARDGQRKGVKE